MADNLHRTCHIGNCQCIAHAVAAAAGKVKSAQIWIFVQITQGNAERFFFLILIFVWDMTMAVNLTGSTRMALAVGKTMIENGGGSIINIPSRRFGYPEEVAACAVYLASDAASLFNGANLVLDGGFTIA